MLPLFEHILKIIIIIHINTSSDIYELKMKNFKQEWLFLNSEAAIQINELELCIPEI